MVATTRPRSCQAGPVSLARPALLFGLYYFLRGDINFSHLRHVLSAPDVEHAVEEETIDPAVDLLAVEAHAEAMKSKA